MAAIITDQLRILNAKNFVAGVASTANSYYTFVGLPNATDYDSDWESTPPAPVDNFNNENDYVRFFDKLYFVIIFNWF